MICDKDIKQYLSVSLKAAKNSAIILKKFWGKLSEIKNKKISGDLITEADQNSEIEILNILKKSFPNHSILAEESGQHSALEKDFIWTIDPLDGTTNYAHEFPFFAISIALLFKGKPIVGVVYNPIMNELFYASKGRGAFLNEKKN